MLASQNGMDFGMKNRTIRILVTNRIRVITSPIFNASVLLRIIDMPR